MAVGKARPAQHELVRTGDRATTTSSPCACSPAHPRPDAAVVGAHHPVVPHPHRAARAGRGGVRRRRGRRRPASRRAARTSPSSTVKVVSRHAVSSRYRREVATTSSAGAEQPAAVLRGAEQRGEAGGGVEARQAQPVDRPVLADQGGRAPVTDQCVVLDGECHAASVADMGSAESEGSVAARVLEALADRGETLATAESLTGGLLSARLTDVPGASRSFVGGVVSYATRVKVSLLGVPPEVVQEHGVVSEECASRWHVACASGSARRGPWPPPASPDPTSRKVGRSGRCGSRSPVPRGRRPGCWRSAATGGDPAASCDAVLELLAQSWGSGPGDSRSAQPR